MGRKLLVADDSVTIQKVIKLALSSEGYDILAVSEGKEAIRAIQEERPDVVLIDVTLPGADAYEVKRVINQDPLLSKTGFILMLSAFERVDEKAIDEVKFHARLIKPFDPSHLRKAVADLLAKIPVSGTAQAAASAAKALGGSSVPPPPPAMQAEGNSKSFTLAPASQDEDLPPIKDMHPTIHEEPSKLITEDEFNLDTNVHQNEPLDFTSESNVVPEQPDAPPLIMISPPPPPQIPASMANIEHTDPNFTLPPEASLKPTLSGDDDEADAADRTLENDIKDLTESTIKMSGLDDFQWNLDDTNKMKAPPAQPTAPKSAAPTQRPTPVPTAATPPTPINRFAGPGNDERTAEIMRPSGDKKAAVIKSLMSAPNRPIDDGGSNFPLSSLNLGQANAGNKPRPSATSKGSPASGEPVPRAPGAPPPASTAQGPKLAQPPIAPPSLSPPPGSDLIMGRDYVTPTIELNSDTRGGGIAAPITRAEIEELVRRDLEAVIEKLAREAVPRIAEQIIREQIEKILAEP